MHMSLCRLHETYIGCEASIVLYQSGDAPLWYPAWVVSSPVQNQETFPYRALSVVHAYRYTNTSILYYATVYHLKVLPGESLYFTPAQQGSLAGVLGRGPW